MAHFFNYYYIGENNLADENLDRDKPILLSLSKVQNGKKGETDRYMHTHMEIFYFESGTGFFEFRNDLFPIKANDLLVIDSKQVHMQYSDSNSQPLTYYCFAVENLRLKGRDPNCLTTQGYLLHTFDDENNPIYGSIQNILDELQSKQYCFFNKIQAYFTEILIDIIRLERQNFTPTSDTSEGQKRDVDNYLSNIKEYILTHYAEDLTLE